VILLVVFISVDDQGGPPGQCGMRRPMRHAQVFTQSHWMPLPGKYFCHITLAAAMVIDVGAVRSRTKHNFLASVPYGMMDRPIDFFGK
jgi:hypothetical protein